MSKRGEGWRDTNELRDGLNSVRIMCLRTFPEFLADLKLTATGPGKGGELGVSLADFTVSVSVLSFFLGSRLTPLASIRPYGIWIEFRKCRKQLDRHVLHWVMKLGDG